MVLGFSSVFSPDLPLYRGFLLILSLDLALLGVFRAFWAFMGGYFIDFEPWFASLEGVFQAFMVQNTPKLA